MATKEEILESIANMSVLEVSSLIKMMEEKFGVVAAAAAAGPAAAVVAEAVEEPTEFNVILVSCDPTKKIAAIKEVRALTGLGLKEAKDLVEAGNAVIKESVSKADAEAIKEKLVAASCAVEIKPVD
ncbi:50S ribosomal protein L7/L12 [Sphaerochaeta sp. PS]|jgi:large subunit ribosomal protein L7/L12|uniref:50S ribosomal protein L7/L12 n=1 Tax=Sphaerochaeta sp. PS TaxID=3076336 RepID=UPI0028A38ABF|nr:50S ribosomal protein L7/L12 [Sphaerochaeta sp. PS]MDT4760915.1 50S ribosomal protein L7/L12 [Sphaerochaeta sp. PS]